MHLSGSFDVQVSCCIGGPITEDYEKGAILVPAYGHTAYQAGSKSLRNEVFLRRNKNNFTGLRELKELDLLMRGQCTVQRWHPHFDSLCFLQLCVYYLNDLSLSMQLQFQCSDG